jgi:hypothetical protein
MLTSSVFLRRQVIEERGLFFDTRWRAIGDSHWARALLQHQVPMAVCDAFASVFTETGKNFGLQPDAVREIEATMAMAPGWVRLLRPAGVVHHRLRRLAAGHFSLKPTSYSIYTLNRPEQRVTFDVPRLAAVLSCALRAKCIEARAATRLCKRFRS